MVFSLPFFPLFSAPFFLLFPPFFCAIANALSENAELFSAHHKALIVNLVRNGSYCNHCSSETVHISVYSLHDHTHNCFSIFPSSGCAGKDVAIKNRHFLTCWSCMKNAVFLQQSEELQSRATPDKRFSLSPKSH